MGLLCRQRSSAAIRLDVTHSVGGWGMASLLSLHFLWATSSLATPHGRTTSPKCQLFKRPKVILDSRGLLLCLKLGALSSHMYIIIMIISAKLRQNYLKLFKGTVSQDFLLQFFSSISSFCLKVPFAGEP